MRATPQNVKKTWNGNFLVEVDSLGQAENIKIKSFHTTKCKAYPHKRMNISKGIVRSRELALATTEMLAALKKQGVTNIRRVSIRKGRKQIETNICILTFNQPHILKVKIGYCLKRVEQYISAPLEMLQMTKIWISQGDWHVQNAAKRTQATWRKNTQMKRNDQTANKTIQLTQDCDIYKKEKEMLEMKDKRNVTFLEARKLVGSYLGENTYASIA